MAVSLQSPSPRNSRTEQNVHDSVRQRLLNCPFKFIYSRVTWRFDGGILTLEGCVPSFYLKQVLQESLKGIQRVDQIKNEVDVVNASGLSSVRKPAPR